MYNIGLRGRVDRRRTMEPTEELLRVPSFDDSYPRLWTRSSLGILAKLVIFLSLPAILISFLGCGQQPEYNKIDFRNIETAEVPASEPPVVTLRVAAAGVLSPTEELRIYDKLVTYFAEALHQPVELVQRRTYAEINDLVKSRYVDLAFVCGFPYVAGHKEFGMELLVVPEVNREAVYYSYILVPAESDATELKDLRGKTFAFTDPMSNSGRLAPTYRLYKMGETPDSFFGKYIFTYSHDNSIRATAEKRVDGAAIDSLVYDYIIAQEPVVGKKTRIIETSPPYGIPPVVVHPALNQEIKARLRGLFLDMHRNETGREIINALAIDRFVIGNNSAYDAIREMANVLEW